MVEHHKRFEDITEKLRERGHRLTPQRMAVIKILVDNQEHLSVEQIYERVQVDFPMTSLATIYKTVAVLKDIGEILELGFSGESKHYDGSHPDPHPHLVCINCGGIIDIEVKGITELPQEVAQKTGYHIVNHRLDFFGICPQCQEDGQ